MGRHKYTVQILQHFTYGKFEGIYFKYFNFNTFLDNFFSFTIESVCFILKIYLLKYL